ncbi:RNA polymerase, sigma-24 subunit, ECF subfamily protein [Alcaligenes faecalis subsp. faecalis NCIB 8687]|uniref:ECF sigma factor-z n=1 Tax=Alcaligenes faecalis TaxID=511 RepID=Q6WB43_ALCFA|nr:ECF sigma factor-z [Alcaligenes faecalis subsp. faecalis NCIB 8687]EJC61046.1 RNA polymerase, sigma-24 subunit, ECF subfamily protein [Alcaligenes faecalis subsp. faecalis NCIB 8687]EJC61979.1 RNA polymerase, sigma-24 subunit, ECF subfamily protein [Alcaligenes faecalis subsp. faecalis NCIB 8687]
MAFECVTKAWQSYHSELRRFLVARLGDEAASDDVLQDVFFRAMRSGSQFCELNNSRAWLYEVTRNAVIDRHRMAKVWVPASDELIADSDETQDDPVVLLESCLINALGRLAPDDRDILEQCDLAGDTQAAYAKRRGLSLPAVKARIRRARERLRDDLVRHCDVQWDSANKVCCHRAFGG